MRHHNSSANHMFCVKYNIQKSLIVVFLFIFCLFPTSNLTAQPQKEAKENEVHRVQNYIAVMDLNLGKGVNPELRILLTNGLMDELVGIGRYTIIDRANRNKILKEQGFQLSDACDDECRVQVGRLLGVGKIVIGSITKIENTYFGMVQLINVETGKIESSAKEQCECSPIELLKLIRVLAGKLMGLPMAFAQYEQKRNTPYMPGKPTPSEVENKGGLYIKTDPIGAEVTLNEQRVGETPLTLANLTTGNYRIEVRKGDYFGRMDVDVVADQFSTISIPMELLKASLTVITEPPEAQIFLDGQEVGRSPTTLTGVAVGEHRIEAQKQGYVKTGEDVSVAKSEEMVTISLVKGGVIKIISDPNDAQIEIEGKNIGSTPKEYLVPPGNYQVGIIKTDYQSFESRVQINAGEEKTVQATLVPNFGFLNISSNPSSMNVLVNGKSIGKTPIKKEKIPLGKNKIEVQGNNRFSTFTDDIETGPGEEKKLEVVLNYKPEYLSLAKSKRKTANIVSISGLGLAAVGTGLTVFFQIWSDSAYDNYKKAGVQSDINRYRDDYNFRQDLSYVGLGVIGAGLVTGAIAFLARPEIPQNIGQGNPTNVKQQFSNSVFQSNFQAFLFPSGLGMELKF